jgi:hypothetical protein
MPGIALPEEILHIIWRKVYSNYLVSNISRHAKEINRNLKQKYYTFALYPVNYKPSGTFNINRILES